MKAYFLAIWYGSNWYILCGCLFKFQRTYYKSKYKKSSNLKIKILTEISVEGKINNFSFHLNSLKIFELICQSQVKALFIQNTSQKQNNKSKKLWRNYLWITFTLLFHWNRSTKNFILYVSILKISINEWSMVLSDFCWVEKNKTSHTK